MYISAWDLCLASMHPKTGLKSFCRAVVRGGARGALLQGILGFRKENRKSLYIAISTLRFENLTTVLYC